MVRVERYDDSPGHTHTLTESDILKRPEAIKNLVANEAAKPYRPPEITNIIEDLASKTFGEQAQRICIARKSATSNQSLEDPLQHTSSEAQSISLTFNKRLLTWSRNNIVFINLFSIRPHRAHPR